jgi:hypothetical protein
MKNSNEVEVYSTRLPPTLPVVAQTIDTLAAMSVRQRRFLVSHADRVKLELVRERDEKTLDAGTWTLNGFNLSSEDAVDLIRASPDSLSNLSYIGHKDTQSLWTRLTTWLRLTNPKTSGISVADDLAFALSVAEVVECTGHTLAATAYALSAQSPRIGKPLRRSLAFELTSSRHRGRSHSMYLTLDITHAAQRAASERTTNTLKIDSSLYVHDSLFLGGVRGVAINVSGTPTDDLPEADIDTAELRNVLSRKGTFVASSVSDSVLDKYKSVDSERVATIAMVSCTRLANAANAALSSFLDSEYRQAEAVRMQKRRVERERAIEAAREAEEEAAAAEAEAREAEEAAAREAEAEAMAEGLYDPRFGSGTSHRVAYASRR